MTGGQHRVHKTTHKPFSPIKSCRPEYFDILNFIFGRDLHQRIYCHGPEFPTPLCQLCRPRLSSAKTLIPASNENNRKTRGRELAREGDILVGGSEPPQDRVIFVASQPSHPSRRITPDHFQSQYSTPHHHHKSS